MSFSYLSSDPGSSDRSFVRLMLGDNSSSTVELQDEEIDVLLSEHGSAYSASVAGARAIGARYARRADKTVGRLSISASQISKNYYELAKELQKTANRRAGGADGMYAGGISIADKDSEKADTDRVVPAFERGQFDVTALTSEEPA